MGDSVALDGLGISMGMFFRFPGLGKEGKGPTLDSGERDAGWVFFGMWGGGGRWEQDVREIQEGRFPQRDGRG